MKTFKSIFAKHLSGYVKLRRSSGLKFRGQTYLLYAFDQYVHQQGCEGPLTQELAVDFATANPDHSLAVCARQYQAVRHFSEYLSAFEPNTPRLDPKILCAPKVRPPAYVFTEDELTRLLHEARHLSQRNPIRGITMHAMIGLAASTGMRSGEVVRLDRADVDLKTGVLVVRRSKFFKDRIVPVHWTTLDVLRNYAAIRDVTYPDSDCPAFFISMLGKRFSSGSLSVIFKRLVHSAGLQKEGIRRYT
jgi:integrase